jgi:CHAT domain-containing protein
MKFYTQTGEYQKAWQVKQDGAQLCSRIMARPSRSPEPHTRARAALAGMEATFLEAQGRFKEAEPYHRERLAMMEERKATGPSALINERRKLAQNLSRQGRLFEAELESRLALRESLGLAGKDSTLTAMAVLGVSNILLAQGRLDEADKLVRANIAMLKSLDVSRGSMHMASSQIHLANILFARRSFREAMAEYDLGWEGLRENDLLFDRRLSRNFNWMVTLVKTGRHGEAMQAASAAYALCSRTFGEGRVITAQALAVRAMTWAAAGEPRKALADYRRAVPILTRHMLENHGTFLDRQRLNLIIESFIDLLARIHGTAMEKEAGIDAAAEAFRHVNLLTARSVQTALGSNIARAAARDAGLAELVRKGQDIEMQIDVLQALITDALETPSGGSPPGGAAQMQENLERLNDARKVILDEIKRLFPKYAELVNPQPATLADVKGALGPGEVLLSVYPSESQTYVWAIPHAGRTGFSVAPLGMKEIHETVGILRRALDPNPHHLEDIPEYDVARAYRLYEALLKPVEDSWRDAANLLIVTRGALSQLPLAVLPTGPVKLQREDRELFSRYRSVPWLARRVSLTVLPSVSSLTTLRSLPAAERARRAFAGFGDPIFNPEQLKAAEEARPGEKGPADAGATVVATRGIRIVGGESLDSGKLNSVRLEQLARLPDTAEEIRGIAGVLDADPRRDVFLGAEATEEKVKGSDLSDRRVVSFATHALIPGDLDGLDQPALALSSPQVTGGTEDGLLTMGEILTLKLNADWVVLSACNSGASHGEESEAISGLGRAFFYAGTRALLVSLWPVETTSAKKLIAKIFEYTVKEETLSKADALRRSMLDLIDHGQFIDERTGRVAASYAHPFFWAPFIMVGDPGTAGAP